MAGFQSLYHRGLSLVLGQEYGLAPSDTAECLALVGWDVDTFRYVADRCIWRLSVWTFQEKYRGLRAHAILLRVCNPLQKERPGVRGLFNDR